MIYGSRGVIYTGDCMINAEERGWEGVDALLRFGVFLFATKNALSSYQITLGEFILLRSYA